MVSYGLRCTLEYTIADTYNYDVSDTLYSKLILTKSCIHQMLNCYNYTYQKYFSIYYCIQFQPVLQIQSITIQQL